MNKSFLIQKLRGKKLCPKKLREKDGFTLIEIMIVVTIIAGIATLVGTSVIKKYQESQVQTTKIQMKQLMNVLDDFRRVCSFYPTTEQGLDALVHAPTVGRPCKNYDPEGFIKKLPQDAWGGDFKYESSGSKYELKSLGPEQKEGGEGVISSNDL